MIKKIRKTIIVAVLSTAYTMPLAYAEPAIANDISQTLMAMESPAEDMLDAIDNKDMSKLKTLYHGLEISMSTLNLMNTAGNAGEAQRKKIAMQNAWFELISLEIKEADDLPALANAINQFSGQLIITTHFQHHYQKDIAWMDYLGRELLLLNKYPSVSTNHAALIKARKLELQATWLAVQAAIGKNAAGIALVESVEPIIHALVTESASDKLVKLSIQELDLVDNIEKYFKID